MTTPSEPKRSSAKAYVMTTGALSVLLALAHLGRIMLEGVQTASDPWFILTTAISAGLALWAWQVLRRLPRT